MRFLIDENLPRRLKDTLGDRGHDVSLVQDQDFQGASDELVTEFAIKERRILITRDLDFPIPGAPALPGLLLVRAPDDWLSDALTTLVASVFVEPELELLGKITVVSPGRTRQRGIGNG